MECIVCKKNVNEMTFFCDECGAQLLEDKVRVNLENIDEMILNPEFDQRFNEEFEEEIRRAYYLSLISTRVTGETLLNLEKYFDYFYLRLMFEEYKTRFLENESTKEKGLVILTALYKKTITSEVQTVLKEEYATEYVSKKIPKHIINQVPQIYLTKERNVRKIVKHKFKKNKTLNKQIRKEVKPLLKKIKKSK